MIEELYKYANLQGKEKTRVHNILGEIANTCRSAGIHLLFCSQKYHDRLIPKRITDICDLRIGLRSGADDSKNFIGDDSLAGIAVNDQGRGYVVTHEKREFRALWIENDVLQRLGRQNIIYSDFRDEIRDDSKNEALSWSF